MSAPVAAKQLDELIAELDARVADAQSFRRPLGSVAAKEKVILKLPLVDSRRSVQELFGSDRLIAERLAYRPAGCVSFCR